MSEKTDLGSDSQTGSVHRNRKQNHAVREVVDMDSESDDDSSNSEPEQLVVSNSILSSNDPRSENKITNENEMSPEQAKEKKSNQQLLMNPSTGKMSTKKYRAHILSTSTIFVVDNVKLYVKNSVPSSFGAKDTRIHLDCPCCPQNETVEPYTKIGEHLKDVHDVTHISCPGSRCGKFKEIDVRSFRSHLETFHMTILCQYCSKPLSALKIIEHIMRIHPDKHKHGGKISNQERSQ